MKNKIQVFIFIFFISFSTLQIKASPNYKFFTEEVSSNETSSVSFLEKDSIFLKKYKQILKVYKSQRYEEALKDALELYEETKNNSNLENTYKSTTLVANVYNKGRNHKKALFYYKQGLALIVESYLKEGATSSPLSKDLAGNYLRIGSSYQYLKQKDSAIAYYKKIENLNFLDNEGLKNKALAFANLTGLYETDSLHNKAIYYANESIKINKKINNNLGQATVLNNLANIYMAQNKFEEAKEKYFEGIEIIKNDNSEKAVRKKADLYFNLAWSMRNLKEYEAYDYQEKSYEIEENIRDVEIKRIIEKVTAEYNVDNVKKEEENKRFKQKTTFLIYGGIALIIILALLFWLNFYKLKQKNLSLKLSQTQLLQNRNIEKLKSDSQARILNATIDGKESERKEIAETLHDSVSALLSSANLHLIATKQYFNGKTPIEIDKTQNIITEASQKIRDLSHTLVSSVLLKFGLNFAIKDMATKYSNSVLNIETDVNGLQRYHQNFEIKVYNIMQEFVNNILKHSKANNAFIRLFEKDNCICFDISDDGIGFDKTKITEKDGLGINQIEARIQMMNGEFSIKTSPGEGTVINVKLPVVEREKFNHV